jgi:hypothetical protein
MGTHLRLDTIIPGINRVPARRTREEIINSIMQCNTNITLEEAISFLEAYSSALQQLADHTLSHSIQNNPSSVEYAGTHYGAGNAPVLVSAYNVVCNNRTVMAGSIVQVRGWHLEFDKTDRKQGVFLVDTHGFATRANSLVRQKPEEVIFMIPGGLAAGEYQVEIRTRDLLSAEVLAGTFPEVLTVIL